MEKRGRKSAAELAVAQTIEIVPRAPAPDHLNDAEAEVWERHVASMSADYFRRSDHDVLANLCRHTVASRRISEWIENALDDPDLETDTLDRLHKMRERETRAQLAMARTLRLTKQSQIEPRGAARRTEDGDAKKPWE